MIKNKFRRGWSDATLRLHSFDVVVVVFVVVGVVVVVLYIFNPGTHLRALWKANRNNDDAGNKNAQGICRIQYIHFSI